MAMQTLTSVCASRRSISNIDCVLAQCIIVGSRDSITQKPGNELYIDARSLIIDEQSLPCNVDAPSCIVITTSPQRIHTIFTCTSTSRSRVSFLIPRHLFSFTLPVRLVTYIVFMASLVITIMDCSIFISREYSKSTQKSTLQYPFFPTIFARLLAGVMTG